MDRRQHADASPTERTLAEVRSRGWYASPCEAWRRAGARCVSCDMSLDAETCPTCGKPAEPIWYRCDFLGFADVLAMPIMLLIQTTVRGSHATRVSKILQERQEAAWYWLSGGGQIEVWSWGRLSRPINGRWWRLKITAITPVMILDAGFLPPEFTGELFPIQNLRGSTQCF